MEFKLLCGDVMEQLQTLSDKSINTCVTSPPYYGLRDYGTGTWVGGDPSCPHYRTTKRSDITATGHKAMMETGHPMKIQTIKAKSILTKSPVHHGYTASPYAGCQHSCVYCYAQYLKDWTGHEQERWGEYVDVKQWEPLTEKQKAKLHGAEIFISSATDPYQSTELEYCRTRRLLEELIGTEANVLVVTKSTNVLRDCDILRDLNATVALSINTLDENFRADMDKASTIKERLITLKALHNKGIHTVCFVSPIFPAITDVPAIIKEVTGKCDAVWIEHLVLNGDYKGPVLYYVKTHYPMYYEFYDRIFNKGELDLWWQFDDYMEQWCRDNGYEYQYGKFPKEHREIPTVSNFRGHKGK